MNAHQKHSYVDRLVIANYDFNGNGKGELSFMKMDRMIIVSPTDDPNWLRARNYSGQEGLIPLEYVDLVKDNKTKNTISSNTGFHGKISRDEAENLLSTKEDGLFLIRESTNFHGDYTLCVCFEEKVEHYRIINNQNIGKLTIDEEEKFDNLDGLVEHYKKDADGLCTKLKRPVPKYISENPEQIFAKNGLTINVNDLTIRECLGKGEFGEVLLADLNGKKVAVKRLKDHAAESLLEEAFHMTKMNHENLVALKGIAYEGQSILLITEFMSKGSLVDYLRSRGRILISKRNQIDIACDVAKGMVFLESKDFVHRDLAARNVLLDENGTAKVSDFGLTLKTNEPLQISNELDKSKFPIKWTAPEALKQSRFTNKSDMWSFGILLWEIYSFGRVPYPRIAIAEVIKYVESGNRMERPDDCPEEIYQMMLDAWNLDPDKRPNFIYVFDRLEKIQKQT